MPKKKRKAKASAEKAELERVAPTTSDKDIARARRIPIGWHEAFLGELRSQFHIGNCAHAAGIARSTFYDHLKIFPQFADKYNEIMDDWVDAADEALYNRAVYGVESDVFGKDGVVVGKKKEYSDRLLEFFLRGRRRQIYGDKVALTTAQAPKISEAEEFAAHDDAIKSITATIRAAAMRGVRAVPTPEQTT